MYLLVEDQINTIPLILIKKTRHCPVCGLSMEIFHSLIENCAYLQFGVAKCAQCKSFHRISIQGNTIEFIRSVTPYPPTE